MLKPIVSMNQMAMNESIATTCCFKWGGTAIDAATVLHGGKLDVKYNYTYYYPETNKGVKVSDGWLGVGVAPTYTYADRTESGEYMPYRSSGAWGNWEWAQGNQQITYDARTKVVPGMEDEWKIVNPETFYKKVQSDPIVTHVGATSAHYKFVSGHNWLMDHTAVQYSS